MRRRWGMPHGERGEFLANGFIGKVARFAVSKAAGFSYAVAVGVAGNLAFHFVQPHDPAPSVATPPAVVTAPQPAQPGPDPAMGTATAAPLAPKPLAPVPHAAPQPTPVSLPEAAPARPAPGTTPGPPPP